MRSKTEKLEVLKPAGCSNYRADTETIIERAFGEGRDTVKKIFVSYELTYL